MEGSVCDCLIDKYVNNVDQCKLCHVKSIKKTFMKIVVVNNPQAKWSNASDTFTKTYHHLQLMLMGATIITCMFKYSIFRATNA